MRDPRPFALAVGVLLLALAGCSGVQTPPKTYDATAILRQRVDYVEREKTAPPAVKQKLTDLRQEIKDKGYTFDIGYTTALDVPLEVLAATRIPANLKEIAPTRYRLGQELLHVDLQVRDQVARLNPNFKFPDLLVTCNPKSRAFDWRRLSKVTPVKSQICGTCWDFTSMGAYEGSYAIRNNVLADTSEEYILECAHAGSCAGGWWMPVFDFMISNGTATESAVPFTGVEGSCPTGVSTPYRASAWGFVTPSGGIPTVDEMKQALCAHGPLAVAVRATPLFQGYTGGPSGDQVFNEHDTNGINHGVTLIGWDDAKNAWVIKNSWGPGWGSNAGVGAAAQKGYMYIAYDSNSIGYAAAWVDAQNRFYKLSIDWLRILEREKIPVKPLPDPERLRGQYLRQPAAEPPQ